ncbi:ABC1 family-domain-containing protein [Pelagophyceae sp. CCMP2097]|nr:ABC1 family-domain-containing protein [Pelagophyceae sp. CCMP2097]
MAVGWFLATVFASASALSTRRLTVRAAAASPGTLSLPERLGRSARFYSNIIPILAKYKLKEVELKRKCASEEECEVEYTELDEWGSTKLRDTIIDLQGFYVKSGQVMSTRVDLFPKAYTDKLQVLQDGLAPLDAAIIKDVIRTELLAGADLDEVFATFDDVPIGCASIAQVHAATLLDGRKVAVKVQRPNCEPKLLGDVANLQRFAKLLAKQLPVDYYTVFRELGDVLLFELDFLHEAQATEKIAASLSRGGTVEPPLFVPLPVPGLASRRVLVLEFCEGVPLSKLAAEAKKRGILPGSPEARLVGRTVVTALADAYACMIFDAGFVHGDPHPGNVFVQPGGGVALLDCGQVKQLTLKSRATIGALVVRVAEAEGLGLSAAAVAAIAAEVRRFGVTLQPRAPGAAAGPDDDDNCLAALALLLFGPGGATLPGGYSSDELSQDSPVRRVAAFPPEFVLLGRAAVLIKGIATRLDVPGFSLARRWEPAAAAAAVRDRTSPDALPAWSRRRTAPSTAAPTDVTFSDVASSVKAASKLAAAFALRKVARFVPARVKAKAQALGARLLLRFS